VAQAAIVQAGLLSNPVFDVAAERGTGVGGDQLDAAVLDFLDVFYIPLRRGLATSKFEAAKLAITAAAMDLAFDTRIAFVSMQAEEQQLEMRRQVLASTEASLTSAQELREAGNVTSLDVDNQQTLLDRARLNVAVEAAVVVSRERLNRLMGLWGDDVEWQAAQRLPDVPSELPPGDLEAQAVESSVDLALARQQIESAGRQLGMTETTALIPELHVGPLIAREEGSTRIGAIVEVPLPLFDRGQARSAKDRAVLQGLQAEYVALAVELRSNLRSVRQ
jgi:cobalt-zinc-cadmium efflux system outer membrane protein